MVNGYQYDQSNFAKFFDSQDAAVSNWFDNVLEKVYYKGVLSEAVIRNKDYVLENVDLFNSTEATAPVVITKAPKIINSAKVTISASDGMQFNNSNFAGLFNSNDTDVELLTDNLLTKIYYKGALSECVIRNKDFDLSVDDLINEIIVQQIEESIEQSIINQALNIGDSFVYTFPVFSSISSFVAFSDDITGLTSDRYFTKQFRYSTDGLYWSNYVDLSYFNVASLQLNVLSSYIVQVKYTRGGTDNSGVLILNSATLSTVNEAYTNGKQFDTSNFAALFESKDSEVENWNLNVLKKIYYKGSLSEYVLRGKDAVQITDLVPVSDNLETDSGIDITTDGGDQLIVD